MRPPRLISALRLTGVVLALSGALSANPGAHASTPRTSPPAAPIAQVRSPEDGAQVYALPQLPVHLWQTNPTRNAYRNPMGCGAFTTAMALSVYDRVHYGSYSAARRLFTQMVQVPVFGGTFEGQNAEQARQAGFTALSNDHGTVADLVAAVNLGAPVILLVDPGLLGIGRHDVLLVGYRVGRSGRVQQLLVDDPLRAGSTRAEAPAEPGNLAIPVADLPRKWTGVFTPIFASPARAADWQRATGR
jgi:hypothetical protein